MLQKKIYTTCNHAKGDDHATVNFNVLFLGLLRDDTFKTSLSVKPFL